MYEHTHKTLAPSVKILLRVRPLGALSSLLTKKPKFTPIF